MVCLGTLQKSDIHVPNLIQRSDRIISMKGIWTRDIEFSAHVPFLKWTVVSLMINLIPNLIFNEWKQRQQQLLCKKQARSARLKRQMRR